MITLYHQCQSTVGRIVTFLNDLGLGISSRQVRRYLNEATRMIVEEAGEVLKAGLRQAQWINVDDTGARYQAHNGYCTVIGNDRFTHFRSTGSKGRLNFLEHLCAGEDVYTVNAAAVSYWHGRRLPKEVIALLVEGGWRTVDGTEAWHRHLHTRGLGDKKGAVDRLKANRTGLLRVLEVPFTPLHTNGAENDLRAQVTRRQLSFGTRSEAGRRARDAGLGAAKTCHKLGVSFWDYLHHRLGVAGAPVVPRLADLIAQTGEP